MNGESGSHKTQITIAVITLSGVVFTALLSNWDKIFSPRATQAAAVSETPAPSAQPAALTPGPPTDSVARYAEAQRSALNASSGALEGIATQISNASAIPSIGGSWADAEGYRYEIEQKGDSYQYRQTKGFQETGYGSGTIIGSSIRQSYYGDGGSGECTGTIESGGGAISGSCITGGEPWTFRVFRDGGGKKG